MPKLTSLSLLIWVGILIAQPLLTAALWRAGVWRRWPSLLCYLAFASIKSATLAVLFYCQAPVAYFWTYWVGLGIATCLELVVLREVVTSLLGTTGRAWQRLIFAAVSIVSVVTATVVTLHTGQTPLQGEMATIAVMDRILSLAWCLIFFVVTVFSDAIGVKWADRSLRIAMGFACHAAGEAAWSWLAGSPAAPHWAFLSTASDLVYLFTLGLWAFAFRAPETITFTAESTVQLRDTLESFEAIQTRLGTPSC